MYLRSNQVVADRALTFVPLLGDDDSKAERDKAEEMLVGYSPVRGSMLATAGAGEAGAGEAGEGEAGEGSLPVGSPTASPAAGERASCSTCGLSTWSPGNEMLLCDKCDAGYHMHCLPRPLPAIPSGDWFCPACDPAPPRSALSSLFCRRCFTYDCALHGTSQPLPRWHDDEPDAFADLGSFLGEANAAAGAEAPGAGLPSSARRCTCRLAATPRWVLPVGPQSGSELGQRPPACWRLAQFGGERGAAGEAAAAATAAAAAAAACGKRRSRGKRAARGPSLAEAAAEAAGAGAAGVAEGPQVEATLAAQVSCIFAWGGAARVGEPPPKKKASLRGGAEAEAEGAVESEFDGEGEEGGGRADGRKTKRPRTAAQLRLKLGNSHRELSGTMCDHDGPCDTSTPGCVCIASSNYCEVFCACGPRCKNRFTGCKCRTDCRTKSCPCFALQRECDPDLCACAASNFASCGCDACMPAAPGGERRVRPRGRPPNRVMTHSGPDGSPARRGGGSSGLFDEPEGLFFPSRAEEAEARAAAAAGGSENADAPLGSAPVRCRNMSVQLREQIPLLVGPSSIKGAGWGAFAPHAIERNEFLSECARHLPETNGAHHGSREPSLRWQVHGRAHLARRGRPPRPGLRPARLLVPVTTSVPHL